MYLSLLLPWPADKQAESTYIGIGPARRVVRDGHEVLAVLQRPSFDCGSNMGAEEKMRRKFHEQSCYLGFVAACDNIGPG